MKLSEYQTQIRAILNDAGKTRFPDTIILTALRICLNTYSMASPHQDDYVFTVTATGREQIFSALTGLNYLTIIEISYPYEANAYQQPLIENWYTYQTGNYPAIYFTGNIIPQAGKQILIRYAAAHTIQDLDGAATTTVRGDYEMDLAMGTAGQAILLRAAGLPESYGNRSNDLGEMITMGNQLLGSFQARLASLRAVTIRAQGPFPSIYWKLDPWDRR